MCLENYVFPVMWVDTLRYWVFRCHRELYAQIVRFSAINWWNSDFLPFSVLYFFFLFCVIRIYCYWIIIFNFFSSVYYFFASCISSAAKMSMMATDLTNALVSGRRIWSRHDLYNWECNCYGISCWWYELWIFWICWGKQ